jgi:hypothetical protein
MEKDASLENSLEELPVILPVIDTELRNPVAFHRLYYHGTTLSVCIQNYAYMLTYWYCHSLII